MPKEPTPRIKIFSPDQLEEMADLGLDPMDVAINSGYDDYQVREAGHPDAPLVGRKTGGMVKKYYSHGSKAKKKAKKKKPRGWGIARYKGFK
jgi:hypothetical protein